MKKVILAFFSILVFLPSSVLAASTDNIANPQTYNQPVISWGNSSYHDLLGARDPFVVKDNSTYYLYYDCTENLLNPSFESNLGTNGWNTWHAGASSTTERKLFGERSLKVETDGTSGGGAYTGNYYYSNDHTEANLAQPTGMLVTPNTTYIASAYFWADSNTSMGLVVKQYKSDPNKFGENVIDSASASIIKKGNNNWQSIFVKFTTASNAKAVTISFASPIGSRTTSFWDGVQLERITGESISAPSEFPASLDFNRSLEETIGWKSCVATSSDGINFTKKGPLKVLGVKGNWERESETAGFSGTSFMYANVFPYHNKWYAYTWEAWHPVDRNALYWDLATQLPNGDGSSRYPARSGLSVADSPLGPFTRISQNSPAVEPTDQSYCEQQIRSCSGGNMVWGCDYITANGVPHQINGQWVLFLAGQTQYQNGVWAGTGGYAGDPPDINHPEAGCHAITSGYATSSSPLGPWTPWSSNPLFTPRDQVTKLGTAEEGPIYYFDRGSGNHVLFFNAISGGVPRVDAFWTKLPLNHWPGENKAQVITQYSNLPWIRYPRKDISINLPTVAESPDDSKLYLYFGVRDGWEETGESGVGTRGYLFHDIGLATLNLPLLSSTALTTATTPVLVATPTPTVDHPQAMLRGPAEGSVGQTLNYIASFTSSTGLEFANVWIAKDNNGQGTRVTDAEIANFNQDNLNCKDEGCIWYKLGSSIGETRVVTNFTPLQAGNYKIIVDAKPTGANSNQRLCSGNPYVSYPISSGGNTYYNCGISSKIDLVISASNASSPSSTPSSTDTPEYTTKVQVAYDSLPTDWSTIAEQKYTENMKVSNIFSPTPGDKFIFVKFKTNKGKEQVRQLKIVLVVPASSPTPVTTIAPTIASTSTSLSAPQNLQSNCLSDGRSVTVSWNSVVGADGYLLRLNKQPFNDWKNEDDGDFGYSVSGGSNTTQRIAIVPNSSYEWSVQPVKPNEKYPFKGQYGSGTLKCDSSQTVDPSYPTASISGPNSAVTGENLTYNVTVAASSGFKNSDVYIAKTNGTSPARITAADTANFDVNNFNCTNTSSTNCAWYKIGSSASSTSYSVTFTPATVGHYVIIVVTQAASGQKSCGGNPYVSYPIFTGGVNYLSCGDKSVLYLGVSSK